MTVTLTACSNLTDSDSKLLRDRADDYRQAEVTPSLVAPASVTLPVNETYFAIPGTDTSRTLNGQFTLPRPEPLGRQQADRENVQIQSLNDQQWLLINEPPGQVWPQLRNFFTAHQLPLERADVTRGILETAVLQPIGENVTQERYRLRIEQGIQPGTSEVYVTQYTVTRTSANWPEYSSDLERERIMLAELADYLSSSTTSAPVSKLAQQTISSTTGKVSIEQPANTQPYLALQLPYDRAWESLGQALERAGFTIEDRDRHEHFYEVRFVKSEAVERSFLANLFRFASKQEDEQGIAYVIDIQEASPTLMIITVRRQNNEPMITDEELELLTLIKRHME